jgi:Leucine-rich repeat (LRR) protein
MRWLRFRMRHLLLLFAVLALLLVFGGKWVRDAHNQRQLIALIQGYGGENHHNLNFKGEPERNIRFSNLEFSPELPGPTWMRRWLGDEYFVTVEEAFFDKASHRVLDDAMFAEFANALRQQHLPRPTGLEFSELPITDATIVKLAEFPELRSLHIVYCKGLTDGGLETVGLLTNLRRLDLRGTGITDRGLAYLSGLVELRELSLSHTAISDSGLSDLEALTNLEYLRLSDTAVSADGRKSLQRQLPKCQITW